MVRFGSYKQKEALLDHIRPDGKRDAPPPPDYWPRSLGEPVSVGPCSVRREAVTSSELAEYRP